MQWAQISLEIESVVFTKLSLCLSCFSSRLTTPMKTVHMNWNTIIILTVIVTITKEWKLFHFLKILQHYVTCVNHTIIIKSQVIGHFRLTFGLFFKASPGAHPFIWKLVFIHMQMKTNFHMKRWAPGLALKKGPKVIRKWPILIIVIPVINAP